MKLLSTLRALTSKCCGIRLGSEQSDDGGRSPAETSVPTTERRRPYAKVELSPAVGPVQQLYGAITTVKIIRPTENRPMLQMYHIQIHPGRWYLLGDDEIRAIAKSFSVDVIDLRKAVDVLCPGGHS